MDENETKDFVDKVLEMAREWPVHASDPGFVEWLNQRLSDAERRVAELEAANEWRPVTELPPKNIPLDIIITDVEFTPGEGWFGDGFFGDSRARYEWRPAATE